MPQTPRYKNNLDDFLPLDGRDPNSGNMFSGATPVYDSDGNRLNLYGGANNEGDSIVANNVRVDIGDSPNSNTGDPLRTAFLKMNNFMEAVARTDVAKEDRFAALEEHGRYIGNKTIEELRTLKNTGASIDRDYAFLSEKVGALAWTSYVDVVPQPDARDRDGLYTINQGALMRWDASRDLWLVENEVGIEGAYLDFMSALGKLRNGEAESDLDPDDQTLLWEQLARVASETVDPNRVDNSYRIKAKNVNDAIVELQAKASIRRFDAGYYS